MATAMTRQVQMLALCETADTAVLMRDDYFRSRSISARSAMITSLRARSRQHEACQPAHDVFSHTPIRRARYLYFSRDDVLRRNDIDAKRHQL